MDNEDFWINLEVDDKRNVRQYERDRDKDYEEVIKDVARTLDNPSVK